MTVCRKASNFKYTAIRKTENPMTPSVFRYVRFPVCVFRVSFQKIGRLKSKQEVRCPVVWDGDDIFCRCCVWCM